MSFELNKRIKAKWLSTTPTFKELILSIHIYSLGDEKGRWGIQGHELWLIKDNSNAGTK